MNYWQEKPDFWRNKIQGNQIYDAQGQELGDHINELIRRHGAYSVLDVGGYNGRMRQYISPDVTYFNYDIINGFDITKPWDTKHEPRMLYDIVFTSLVLVTQPPEAVDHIIDEMRRHAVKAVVLFEENWFGWQNFEDGRKISDEHGGKWQYNWIWRLHARQGNTVITRSRVNEHWAIITHYRI